MANGGARPGAGRKPGSKTRKVRDIAIKAARKGETPVDVMLGAMRALWEQSQAAEDMGEKLRLAKLAADTAEKAAPYIHPKLSPKPPESETNEVHITLIGALTDEG